MANGTNEAAELIPQVLAGLSKLPPEITLPLAAFLLAAFAISQGRRR